MNLLKKDKAMNPLEILKRPMIVSEQTIHFLDDIFNKLPRKHFPLVILQDHQCPICERYITDLNDIEFMRHAHMCLSCDHVLADGWKEFDEQKEGVDL